MTFHVNTVCLRDRDVVILLVVMKVICDDCNKGMCEYNDGGWLPGDEDDGNKGW
ncbi:hypothetical protein Hdeb2414_s0008g00288691 [Helianthus debilis subsp. tardiflorus]